jgi:hypothetical protein
LLVELDNELRSFGDHTREFGAAQLSTEQRAALNVIRQRVYDRYRELVGRCFCRIGMEATK